MYRQRAAAAMLAGLIGAAGAIGALTPSPLAAAAECGTYASETVPPPTIRVLRTASGAVETVDFGVYVKNVLSREWISSWTTESLRSGALAVKHYAWYQVVHWRGYLNSAGECFDVFDSVRDQLYDPSRPTYAAMGVAVDDTWGTLALRGGRLFPTYYNAGSAGEACGANANRWQMHQWGTQACGLDGRSAAEILAIYYSDVTVTDAPAAATPLPTPTPEPMPTPAPSAAPDPTPIPTPSPEPTPAPQPGGGQVDLVAPPPPPPPAPE
ncbi:MAG: SpoIID/LytB domain-containing protein, partial [Candidatus Limnocylindria bacterium]